MFLHRITLAATLGISLGMASATHAFDEAKYPDLGGLWHRIGPDRFDGASNRDAPLTPEYRAMFEKVRKNEAGNMIADPMLTCQAPGMPRVMMAYAPLEFIITPEGITLKDQIPTDPASQVQRAPTEVTRPVRSSS